ncbi:MAG: T9SS C-terminal target domain-containing protein [Calditrichaeota bacterium]|nr:MAG: T9SS C-terminal target domain-containing protein [Calditrichota bacterium]
MKNFVIILGIVAFCGQVCFGQSYQDYVWLTDCERLRDEFVPPDSTNLIFEDCGSSDNFLLLKGPDWIQGKMHTNDFYFFGSNNPSVIIAGCATASSLYYKNLPVSPSSLQYPEFPIAKVNFLDQCNLGENVIQAPPFFFDSELSNDFIFDAQNGGLFLSSDSIFTQRVVFDTTEIILQWALQIDLDQLGPNGTWETINIYPYPQNGAFLIEGDVYVSGVINGDLTLGATGNIFIDNDLKYECSDSTGLILSQNCDDKLGLVSEKNILLETRHIATNKGYSWINIDSLYAHNNHQEGVIINAAIIAFGESFKVFTADFPRFEGSPFPILGNHGKLHLLGTIAQKRRGILNSETSGGYGGEKFSSGLTGPQRVLIYDARFATSPPQNFPVKVTSVEESFQTPSNFQLEQNYPNPFNPTTSINYELGITNYENGKLVIFNILGEKVKEFGLTEQKGSVVWNGINFRNIEVSSGVYFYRLETASGFSKVKKMVFLK